MAEIKHRVGIEAPTDQVYEALASVEGLSGWWTRNVEGDTSVGGRLDFFFNQPEPVAMEVTDSEPGERVVWRCVRGPEDWMETELRFELEASEGETVLRFAHGDWREPSDFFAHCSTKWGYFLLGLKASLEGGQATPFAAEVKISRWG